MRSQKREKGVSESLKSLETKYKSQAELQLKRMELQVSVSQKMLSGLTKSLGSDKELKDNVKELYNIDKSSIESAKQAAKIRHFEFPVNTRQPYEKKGMCEDCGKDQRIIHAAPPAPPGPGGQCPPGYYLDPTTGQCVPYTGLCPPGWTWVRQPSVNGGPSWGQCVPDPTPPNCPNLVVSGVWAPAGNQSVGPNNFDASYVGVFPLGQDYPENYVQGYPSNLDISADFSNGTLLTNIESSDDKWTNVFLTMMIGKHFVPQSKGFINFSAEANIFAVYGRWYNSMMNTGLLGAGTGLAIWELDPSNNYAISRIKYLPRTLLYSEFMSLGLFSRMDQKVNFLNSSNWYIGPDSPGMDPEIYLGVTGGDALNPNYVTPGPPWYPADCQTAMDVDKDHEYILWAYLDSYLYNPGGFDSPGFNWHSNAINSVEVHVPSISWAFYSF